MAEEKLSIEIAEVDSVEIDDVDFAKAGEDEVLEQFAADAASADEQDARLERQGKRSASRHSSQFHLCEGFTSLAEGPYLLDAAGELDSERALNRTCAHDSGYWEGRSQCRRSGCEGPTGPYHPGSGRQRKKECKGGR